MGGERGETIILDIQSQNIEIRSRESRDRASSYPQDPSYQNSLTARAIFIFRAEILIETMTFQKILIEAG